MKIRVLLYGSALRSNIHHIVLAINLSNFIKEHQTEAEIALV